MSPKTKDQVLLEIEHLSETLTRIELHLRQAGIKKLDAHERLGELYDALENFEETLGEEE